MAERSSFSESPTNVSQTRWLPIAWERPWKRPSPPDHRLCTKKHLEWRSLHRVRSSSPSSQKSTSSCSASRTSFQCGRSILGCIQTSGRGAIVGSSASRSVKYVGTVWPFCPLVPGRISGRSNRTSARATPSNRNCHLHITTLS